eukprot:jgi/Chrzof1/2363/Cz11g12110.t1
MFLCRLARNSGQSVVDAYTAVVKDVKMKYPGVKKIGTEGFCWGGKYAVLSTTNTTKTRADAAVVYHGSLITTGDVKAIQRPILFLQSDPAKDPYFNTTFYNQVKTVLADKKFKGQSAAITFYPGQLHGYALRGNDADAKVAAAAQDAFAKGASFLMSGGKMMQTKVTASATATVTVKSG